jgi:hypothetical protein
MTLWTRRRSLVLAAVLALATTPYLVAYLSALSNGGFVLVYQTEMTSRFSYSEHIWISRILYGLACAALITAACAIERKRLLAVVALAIAAPILLNDRGGAVFDFFSVMPWTPDSGPSFEFFYNELQVPEWVWYGVLTVVLVAALYCLTEHLGLWRVRAARH